MIIGQSIQVISIACMGIANSDYVDSPWLTFIFMLVNSLDLTYESCDRGDVN